MTILPPNPQFMERGGDDKDALQLAKQLEQISRHLEQVRDLAH